MPTDTFPQPHTWTKVQRRLAQLGLFLLLLFLIIGGGLYVWLFADLPSVSEIEERRLRPSSQIVDRNGRLLYEVVDQSAGKQVDLDFSRVPEACVQATLSTEDSRFYSHPGFDPIAIGRAFIQNLRSGAFTGGYIASGGSTLTQQVARNLLMEPEERYEQSYKRKLREVWLAWRIEQNYTKDEILGLYLDQAYFGNFAFGLEAAAEVFFAKPAPQLSKAECALLTGLIQYPVGYNPLIDPEAAKGRQLTVLRLMEDSAFINAAESAEIAAEKLRYRSKLFDIEAPHFVMYVQELIASELGAERLRQGGLRIQTTLDLTLQHQAERSIRHRLSQLNCDAPGVCTDLTNPNRRVDNAAAVVLDSRSGEILTMVGSPNYFDESIQGNVNAALSLRQPGSAIKPFTYAAAIDPAWQHVTNVPPLTPADILADLPVSYPVREENGVIEPYTPVNYDRTYHGPVSVRDALANSYNIPTVKILNRISVKTLQTIASQSGITTFSEDHGLALTLGSGEVRLLDLAAGYGIFLHGSPVEPRAILSIEEIGSAQQLINNGQQSIINNQLLTANSQQPAANNQQPIINNQQLTANGQQLTANSQQLTANNQSLTANSQQPAANSQQPVLSPQAAYLVTDILSDNRARIPAFGANSVLNLPFPAAAKTGTTTDWRDNWTIGYTTEHIVGAWVGNADNAPMLDVSGIDGAGPIWRDLMLAAHRTPPPSFWRPDGISEAMICAPSGQLASAYCPEVRRELFIQGSEPKVVDEQFVAIDIDLANGLRATAQTPDERTTERVFWMLPAEYREWMNSNGIELPPPFPTVEQIASLQANNQPRALTSAPLILTAPIANSTFRIAPGLPPESQRIELTGFANTGASWHNLRIVKDGESVVSDLDIDHISTWWTLEAGTHHFWLEGEETEGDEAVRSQEAIIVVEAN